MNVLITSIAAKVPLIHAVRQALARVVPGARVYGADSNPQAVGRYFVDTFWEMPRLAVLAPEAFIAYCRRQQITRVIPTRDAELLYFSRYKALLRAHGIAVMVSDEAAILRTVDKLDFYQYGVAHGFPMIPTACSVQEIPAARYVVKERHGAASRGLQLKVTAAQALQAAETMDEPLFQPFIAGREFSVDLYVAGAGGVHGVVARERLVVRGGESQITRTSDEPEMERLAAAMAEQFGLYGHVMFQVLKNEGGLHVVECNPRFGGASTLSVAAGLDSFYWFLLEAAGRPLDGAPFHRHEEPLTLVRHPQDLIL